MDVGHGLLMINNQKVRAKGRGVLLRRDNKDSGPTQMEGGDRLPYWKHRGLSNIILNRPLGPVGVVTMSQDYVLRERDLWLWFGAEVSYFRFSILRFRIVRDIRHSTSHM